MTERQEKIAAVKLAKKLFQMNYGRIYRKDITLLETGFYGDKIDMILFRNDYTGREYRVCFDLESRTYFIDKMEG